MTKGLKLFTAVAVVALVTTGAQAGAIFQQMYMGDVTFQSDLENPKDIVLPKFDTMGGTRTLLSVDVLVNHSGRVQMRADNDDPFQGAEVRARMIRQWMAMGPGMFTAGGATTPTQFVQLAADDGDGGDNNLFDASGPDGHDFGVISYGPIKEGPFNPMASLYAIDGAGTVTFTITPVLMVNDLQFADPPGPPDAWQLEVLNPRMTVKVKVFYNYIPEPATAGLVGLAGLALVRSRRRR